MEKDFLCLVRPLFLFPLFSPFPPVFPRFPRFPGFVCFPSVVFASFCFTRDIFIYIRVYGEKQEKTREKGKEEEQDEEDLSPSPDKVLQRELKPHFTNTKTPSAVPISKYVPIFLPTL